jgi:hypothetical protein
MGLRPTQGDENGSCSELLLVEAPPSPLSSRPERSVVEISAVSAVFPGNVFQFLLRAASDVHVCRSP